MSNNYLNFLDEALDTGKAPNADSFATLMKETMSFFTNIKEKMENGTEEEKKKAIEEIMAIKGALEKKMKAISEKVGFGPEQFATLMKSMLQSKDQEGHNKVSSIAEKSLIS